MLSAGRWAAALQDLTKDVFRIDAIPSQALDTVREWLGSMDIKFYENKVNLNWKTVLKSIIDVSTSRLLPLLKRCLSLWTVLCNIS